MLLKASRPLIRVLVINDNVLWINDFIWDNEYRSIHGERDLVVNVWSFGDDEQSSGTRQRYKIGLLHFTGHRAFSG